MCIFNFALSVAAVADNSPPNPAPTKPKHRTHFPWFHKKTIGEWVDAEVETVGVGRTVKDGRLIEAHKETRVVKSGHWNTNLPKGHVPAQPGPQVPYTPPYFVPPPESQALSDAQRDAEDARRRLEEQRRAQASQIDQNNALGPQVAALTTENAALKAQLAAQVDAAMKAKGTEVAQVPDHPPQSRTEAMAIWQSQQQPAPAQKAQGR